MFLATLTIDQLQAAIVAILVMLGVVVPAAIAAIIKIWPAVVELRSVVTSHQTRLQEQGSAITDNRSAITRLDSTVSAQAPIVELVGAALKHDGPLSSVSPLHPVTLHRPEGDM